MQVDNPRRFLTFLLIIVGVLFAGYWFVLRDDSGVKTPKVIKGEIPAQAQAIVDATGKQKRILVVTKAKGKVTNEILVTEKGSVSKVDGTIRSLQKDKNVYTLMGGCYQKTTNPAQTLTVKSVAAQQLPLSKDVSYTLADDPHVTTVRWTQPVNAGSGKNAVTANISGDVTAKTATKLMINSAQRGINSAEGKDTVQLATITYPQSSDLPKTPKNLC